MDNLPNLHDKGIVVMVDVIVMIIIAIKSRLPHNAAGDQHCGGRIARKSPARKPHLVRHGPLLSTAHQGTPCPVATPCDVLAVLPAEAADLLDEAVVVPEVVVVPTLTVTGGRHGLPGWHGR